eukprot:100013-Pyramimonas_sp.AAC.1
MHLRTDTTQAKVTSIARQRSALAKSKRSWTAPLGPKLPASCWASPQHVQGEPQDGREKPARRPY